MSNEERYPQRGRYFRSTIMISSNTELYRGLRLFPREAGPPTTRLQLHARLGHFGVFLRLHDGHLPEATLTTVRIVLSLRAHLDTRSCPRCDRVPESPVSPKRLAKCRRLLPAPYLLWRLRQEARRDLLMEVKKRRAWKHSAIASRCSTWSASLTRDHCHHARISAPSLCACCKISR